VPPTSRQIHRVVCYFSEFTSCVCSWVSLRAQQCTSVMQQGFIAGTASGAVMLFEKDADPDLLYHHTRTLSPEGSGNEPVHRLSVCLFS
jgi:hypothetical protein